MHIKYKLIQCKLLSKAFGSKSLNMTSTLNLILKASRLKCITAEQLSHICSSMRIERTII